MLEEFKKILKLHGLSGREFSELMGIEYGSYRSLTRKSATSVPKWVRSAVIIHEMNRMAEDAKSIDVDSEEV